MNYAVIFKMEELQPYENIANGTTSEKLKKIDELASKYDNVKILLQYPYCKYMFVNKGDVLDFFIEAKEIVDSINLEKFKDKGVKQCQENKKNLN